MNLFIYLTLGITSLSAMEPIADERPLKRHRSYATFVESHDAEEDVSVDVVTLSSDDLFSSIAPYSEKKASALSAAGEMEIPREVSSEEIIARAVPGDEINPQDKVEQLERIETAIGKQYREEKNALARKAYLTKRPEVLERVKKYYENNRKAISERRKIRRDKIKAEKLSKTQQ
jgi:hypothetical protein